MNELIARLATLADAVRVGPDRELTSLREFQSLVMEMVRRHPRYQSEAKPAQIAIGILSLNECRSHVSAFLHHAEFLTHLPTTEAELRSVAERLDAEFHRDECSVANLIVLDGLGMPQSEIAFNGGRLVQLDAAALEAWCRGRPLPGAVKSDRLDGVVALEVNTQERNPPFGPSFISWEAPYRTVQKAAHPWLTLLNLFSEGKCSAISLYRRSDSLLHVDRLEAIGEHEPNWEDKSFYDDYSQEWVLDERLLRTLEIEDADRLRGFIERAEAGRRAAIEQGRAHRVGTGLRYFTRVSSAHLRHILNRGLDDIPDDLEDLIVDAVVGLEVILVQDKKIWKKGEQIAQRAAALLESDPKAKLNTEEEAKTLYNLRNSILHGDEQHSIAVLLKNAMVAEELLRRTLAAFCLLSGDNDVLATLSDESTASAVRAQAQF